MSSLGLAYVSITNFICGCIIWNEDKILDWNALNYTRTLCFVIPIVCVNFPGYRYVFQRDAIKLSHEMKLSHHPLQGSRFSLCRQIWKCWLAHSCWWEQTCHTWLHFYKRKDSISTGPHCHLTPPGFAVSAWPRISVCVEFHISHVCMSFLWVLQSPLNKNTLVGKLFTPKCLYTCRWIYLSDGLAIFPYFSFKPTVPWIVLPLLNMDVELINNNQLINTNSP